MAHLQSSRCLVLAHLNLGNRLHLFGVILARYFAVNVVNTPEEHKVNWWMKKSSPVAFKKKQGKSRHSNRIRHIFLSVLQPERYRCFQFKSRSALAFQSWHFQHHPTPRDCFASFIALRHSSRFIQDSAVHLHLKDKGQSENSVHTPDREDGRFEGAVKNQH